jgi:Tfp pilus assembly protein PilO
MSRSVKVSTQKEAVSLPDWKQLRSGTQKSIIVSLAAGVLCLLAVFFILKPALAELKTSSKSVAEAHENFNKLHSNIASLSSLNKEVEVLEEKLLYWNTNGVLLPLANSLDMRAMSLISPIAKKYSVSLDDSLVSSLQQMPILPSEPAEGRIYVRHPIRFSGSGSYNNIVKMLEEIEKKLPMATLSSLRIISQQDDVEKHLLTFSIEWPVVIERVAAPQTTKRK